MRNVSSKKCASSRAHFVVLLIDPYSAGDFPCGIFLPCRGLWHGVSDEIVRQGASAAERSPAGIEEIALHQWQDLANARIFPRADCRNGPREPANPFSTSLLTRVCSLLLSLSLSSFPFFFTRQRDAITVDEKNVAFLTGSPFDLCCLNPGRRSA